MKYKINYAIGGAIPIDDKKYEDANSKNLENTLENIKIINGPMSLYYYNIPLSDVLNKKILLLGEVHHKDFRECVNKDTCIDMTKLLDTIINLNDDKCIDFFLEFSPKKTEGYNITELKGGANTNPIDDYLMIKLRKYALELQNKNNVRVQKFDLRYTVLDDGINNVDINHDILFLRNDEVNFLKNYDISSNISRVDNYKRNIINILKYLMIDDIPNKNIRNMISMLCMVKYLKKTQYGTTTNLEDIILINKNLNKVNNCLLNFDSYLNFLNFELIILDVIKEDHEIVPFMEYINKDKDENNKWREENPDQLVLFYNNKLMKNVSYIREKIKEYLKNYDEDLKKISFGDVPNLNDILIEYFYDIIINTSNIPDIYKAVQIEISFYNEMLILKQKLNKSYKKFLNFCIKYPTIFGSGENIRQDIIEIMTNEENFNSRYNEETQVYDVLFGGRKQMGLNSTLTDLYTFLRMFIMFDSSKEREPNKCNNTETPQKIIVYAGDAHIQLYKSILNKYKDKIQPKIIINNDTNIIFNQIKENNFNRRTNSTEIKNNERNISLITKEAKESNLDNTKKFNAIIEKYRNIIREFEDTNYEIYYKNKELELTTNKDILSDKCVNFDNSTKNDIGNLKDLIDDFIT